MANYVFIYAGEPSFTSREEGTAYMAKWQSWVTGLGGAVINPGNPFGTSKIVSASGVSDVSGANRLTGFSIVSADSIDVAITMAKACPHLAHGTIEVAEAMDMSL